MISTTVELSQDSYQRAIWLLKKRYGPRMAPHTLFKQAILEVVALEAKKMLAELEDEKC